MNVLSIEDPTENIISFLDSKIWNSFKQIIPETGTNIKNYLITEIYQQILEGELTIEGVFQKYNYNDLEESFLSLPNYDFLHLCLELYHKLPIVQPFLEKIFMDSPNIIINCLEKASFSGSYEILTNIANISFFLFNYNITKTMKFREILLRIPMEISTSEIFSFLNTFEELHDGTFIESTKLNKSGFVKLIQKVCSQNESLFWNSIKKTVSKENSLSIDLLKTSFGESKEVCLFLSSVLDETCENDQNTNKSLLLSIPELISFFEETNEIHQDLVNLYESRDKTTYNYLIKSIEKYEDCSQKSKANFFQKLRSLKMLSSSIEIDKLDLNVNLNDHVVTIDQVINYIERSIVGCEQFASKLFEIFHLSFMDQPEQTVKNFCDQFYLKYIKRLQFQTLDKLAEIAIKFLKSDLIQQHRSSLSALAIRLPISKYANSLFFNEIELKSTFSKNISELSRTIQKNLMKEITILEYMHIAAIQTCNYLKLNAQGYSNSMRSQKVKKKNSRNCSLNIISSGSQFANSNSNENSYSENCKLSLVKENFNKTVVGFDRKIILRLRWRTFRDDTSSICSYLPEFIQLCESDEKLFLKWESSSSCPNEIKRSKILMKLGISNNREIISPLIYELLKIDSIIDDNLINILNQVFSNNIDLKTLKIPENPNISILFRFNFLWCTAVMYHPQICNALRNPSKEISLSLLRSLLSNSITVDFFNKNEVKIFDFSETDDKNTKLFDQIFTTFPLGFSAIIAHSSSYGSIKNANKSKNYLNDLQFVSNLNKPPQICLAEQILNGLKKPSKNMPRYLVVSVAFEFAKRNELLHLADSSNGDQLWIFFCFFYSITFENFDVSLSLLKKFDFLFDSMDKGVNEENLFVGPRKWTNGLIKFFNYCSSNNIEFNEHGGWLLLNDIAQNAFNDPNIVTKRKDGEIEVDDKDWISKEPINKSNSSSPLSSQNSCSEHVFSNPH